MNTIKIDIALVASFPGHTLHLSHACIKCMWMYMAMTVQLFASECTHLYGF